MALAEAQYGVVAVAQLEAMGLSASAARSRVATRRLHRVHRGIFAVGRPTLTTEGAYMAAALATGAPIAHGSAAHHRDLLPSPCTRPVHVTTPTRARSRPGIATHSGPAEWAQHRGIPTTTVDQTIIDLAASGRRRDAERALTRADEVHRHDFGPLLDRVAASPCPRGGRLLRTLLGAPPARTRNDLEEAFLAICADNGLPPPRVNLWIPFTDGGGAEADFAWPAEGLVIETDSLTFHRTQRRMDHDYGRDTQLELIGWRVRRVSWRQVFDQPDLVARLAAHLLASAPDGQRRTGARPPAA